MLRDCWADVGETWYAYYIGRGTELLGSRVSRLLNFSPTTGQDQTISALEALFFCDDALCQLTFTLQPELSLVLRDDLPRLGCL